MSWDAEAEQRHDWDSDVSNWHQSIGTPRGPKQRVSGSLNESSAYAPAHDYVVPTTSSSSYSAPLSPRISENPLVEPVKSEKNSRSQLTVEMRASPSQDYLDATLEPSTCLEDPTARRKLLILDLNGTLVFRSPHRRKGHRPTNYRGRYNHYEGDHMRTCDGSSDASRFDPYADPTAQRALRPIHPRPFLPSLRDYLFHPGTRSWLDTMVWSSAQPHSVADMVGRCFGDKEDELVAVWARDTLGLSGEDYNRKTQTTKDLEKPWAFLSPPKAPSENPDLSAPKPSHHSIPLRTGHSAYTTLLLDDSPLKAHLQPWNHICLKEYVAEMHVSDVKAAQTMNSSKEGYSVAMMDMPNSNLHSGAPSNVAPVADTAAEEEVASTDQSSNQESKKRKRQRKKTTKKGKQVTVKEQKPSGGIEDESTNWCRKFDCTLLAVVGVLDAAKRESNLAAWIKNGGLLRNKAASSPLDVTPTLADDVEEISSTDRELSIGADGRRDEKRQRLGSAGSLGGSEPAAQQLWFDDASTMSYWVTRGLRALRELDIEVEAGVRVP